MTQIFFKAPIGNKKEIIGSLYLALYDRLKIPHLEYSIDEGHRGKGIMTRELPKYLKLCKEKGYHRLIANVEKDNEASIKLLERNGFLRLKEFEEVYSYITDLNLTKEELLNGLELLTKKGNNTVSK